MPVVRQPRFELEPLAGKAEVHGGVGGVERLRLAERLVHRAPGPARIRLGHHDGAAEVVGVDGVHDGRGRHVVDDRHRQVAEPDVLASGRPRGVGLGDDVAGGVVDAADGRRERRDGVRKGFARLALLVQEGLKHDPHGGNLFVFRGRRSDLVKIIWRPFG